MHSMHSLIISISDHVFAVGHFDYLKLLKSSCLNFLSKIYSFIPYSMTVAKLYICMKAGKIIN